MDYFFYQQLFISCQDSSPAYIGFTLDMPEMPHHFSQTPEPHA